MAIDAILIDLLEAHQNRSRLSGKTGLLKQLTGSTRPRATTPAMSRLLRDQA
jgi:hypothetical protein